MLCPRLHKKKPMKLGAEPLLTSLLLKVGETFLSGYKGLKGPELHNETAVSASLSVPTPAETLTRPPLYHGEG